MPRSIPAPELIGESVEGAVYELSGNNILVFGAVPESLAGRAPLIRGTLTVSYGLPLLTPPTEAIIPGLFVAEKGGILVGREAWDYIQSNFQIHPRADVVGKRPDGSDIQVFVREIDFGRDVRVFVFSAPEVTKAVAEVTGLIAEASAVPDLLGKYLPRNRDLDTAAM